MSNLAVRTPDIEVYSIDEAWLDLTGFATATLDEYARKIVSETYQFTGIPVSIGIAPTKVLAKLANRLCKKQQIPGQVFNIGSAGNLDQLLQSFDVGDVWGIGQRWAEQLKTKHHIYTALDLRNADPVMMRKYYSVVMQRLIFKLRGKPCLFADEVEPKQQIIVSRSFGGRVTNKEIIMEAVSRHVARACEKLRNQGSVAAGIAVSIRTGAFQTKEPYYSKKATVKLAIPTAHTSYFIQAARTALNEIFKEGPRYAKASVMLFDISQAQNKQYDLFDDITNETSDSLMSAFDAINSKYGKHTVIFGSQGLTHKPAMKQNLMTQRFTTSWSELPTVK